MWSIWGAVTLACLIQILRYGVNIPLAEDWTVVPTAFGSEPLSFSWLWSQNNEHRLPLARLILVGILRFTRDFRAGMFVNWLLLASLAALLIRTASVVRGRIAYSDAFFSLALLHWGHWENIGWSWQVGFSTSTLFVGGLLAGIIALRRLATVGVCLVALPLAGGAGLPFVPSGVLWAALAARTSRSRRAGMVLMILAAISTLIAALYFVGYERPWWNPPSPGIAMTVRTAAGFLALAFGPAVRVSWYAGAAIGTLFFLATFWVSTRAVVWRRPMVDVRSAGLFLFGVGVLALTAGVGSGRAGLVATAGMPSRYALIAAPMLCWAYFVWELYGPARARRAVPSALAILFVVLFPLNAHYGMQWAEYYRNGMEAFQRDVRAGMPASALCSRHQNFLMHWDGPGLCEAMGVLRRAGIGGFGSVAADPAWREVPLGPSPALDRPTFAYAVRFDFANAACPKNVIPLRLFWRTPGAADRSQQDFLLSASTPNEQKSALFWVNGTISEYALETQDPLATVTVAKVVLLVPQ